MPLLQGRLSCCCQGSAQVRALDTCPWVARAARCHPWSLDVPLEPQLCYPQLCQCTPLALITSVANGTSPLLPQGRLGGERVAQTMVRAAAPMHSPAAAALSLPPSHPTAAYTVSNFPADPFACPAHHWIPPLDPTSTPASPFASCQLAESHG